MKVTHDRSLRVFFNMNYNSSSGRTLINPIPTSLTYGPYTQHIIPIYYHTVFVSSKKSDNVYSKNYRNGISPTISRAFTGTKQGKLDSSTINTVATVLKSQESDFSNVNNKIKTKKNKILTWKDFAEFTKFKLSLLNTTVATTSYLMAGSQFGTPECIAFMVATQFLAMCTQSINQYIEVDYDKQMNRTMNRPLAKSRISKRVAKLISSSLFFSSAALYLAYLPYQTFAVGMSIFFGYLAVYTPLKRISTTNTTIGAIVGALPGYLGWAAAGGSMLAPGPCFLSLYIFCWQYPHFYGILWTYKKDYEKAGFKMVDDHKKAANHIKMALIGKFISISCITLCATGSPYFLAQLPLMYWFDYKPMQEFQKNPTIENAKRMKHYSYITFTTFIIALIIDQYYLKSKKQQIKKENEIKEEAK